MSSNPWRYRCPDGHAAITPRGDGYYCQSCGARYRTGPFDAARAEFPVTVDRQAGVDDDDLLDQLVAETGEVRDSLRLRELDGGTTAERREALYRLIRQGYVKRIETANSSADRYRPTDAGRRESKRVLVHG